MIYQILLLIGALGLIAQALFGLAHAGGGRGVGAHSGGHSAGGGTHLHGHMNANASAHGHGHLHLHVNTNSVMRDAAALLLSLLSPLTIFSICLGAGATGMAAEALREKPFVVMLAAIVGGLFFYGALVRPLWKLIFRFASIPAKTMSASVAAEAVAASRFDARGRGVIRLTVDGQTTRVLAYLDAQDRVQASAIAPGDRMLVTSVDKTKNTCRVTRL